MRLIVLPAFNEILQNQKKNIKISSYILASFKFEDDVEVPIDLHEITKDFIDKEIERSPITGTFEFNALEIEKDKFSLNIKIPNSNTGVLDEENYKIIYVFYEDLNTGVQDLGFLLTGNYYINEESNKVEIFPIRLSRNINIINIPLPHNCNIITNNEDDINFLEGKGIGMSLNINKYKDKSSNFISRKSYTSYLLSEQQNDGLGHIRTTFINKFGIKEY